MRNPNGRWLARPESSSGDSRGITREWLLHVVSGGCCREVVFVVVTVQYPLPHIAQDVVKTECIWFLLTDRVWRVTAVGRVPCDLRDHIVISLWVAAPRRVFPLGFGGQSSSHRRAIFLRFRPTH